MTSSRSPICLAEPQPGDFTLIPIPGRVGTLIRVGEWLNGTPARYDGWEHAEVYIGQADQDGPHGYTCSAYPDRQGRQPLPCPPAELPGSFWSSGILPLTGAQRQGIVQWCLLREHVGYGWLDYAALAAHRFRLPVPGLRQFIAATRTLICSQYVDAAWQYGPLLAGAPPARLYADGRWDGYVDPADLAALLIQAIPEAG